MTVGCVYDPIYLRHDTGDHEESAERLIEIQRVLAETGTLARLAKLAPRLATVEDLEMVHTRRHIEAMEGFAVRGGGWLTADTYVSPDSYEVARYAAGGAIVAAEAVVRREVGSAFAVVRPPGHHATPTDGMGFCLFNNVAVASRYVQRRHGVGRVLIVDFDVHHGNGTQDAFYDDPTVLYFSSHQYPLYPGTGHWTQTGSGPAVGGTVNVPLPAYCGDAEYDRVYGEILGPVARKFGPEFILVSAGFDPHWGDPLASMRVTVGGFAGIAERLRDLAEELCGGRIAFCLEGGYFRPALAHAVDGVFRVLLGDPGPVPDPLGPPPQRHCPPDVEPLLDVVKQAHGLT